jgi:putative copper export protein
LIEAGLIASRFLHYATVMALFGFALFPIYIYPSSVGEAPRGAGRTR